VKRQIRSKGVVRALDQLGYQLYYQVFKYKRDQELLGKAFKEHFGAQACDPPPGIPYYEFEDLNSPEAIGVLTKLRPDLVFASCVSQYFKKPYLEIPRLGTVLYHEGLTPEYKGLHTAFWAIYNGEADRIGYTLLQLDEKIDHGEPLAQGVGKPDPQHIRYISYAGHKALIDGLPEVEAALKALENGQRPSVNREKGPAKTYSYPGLSDEVRSWGQRAAG
jgi:hypothetical protein